MVMSYYSKEDLPYEFRLRSNPTNDIGLSVAHIEGGREGGIKSTLEKRVREGVNVVELQLGSGRNMMEHPDSHGTGTRNSIKEIAELNQVEITTVHAPFDFAGYSGWDQKSWSFTDENQYEVKKILESTIDFSADITPNKKGTNIVLHMNEFYRPMSDVSYLEGFELSPNEDQNAIITYMDKTNNTIETAGRNSLLTRESEILIMEDDKIIQRDWHHFKNQFDNLGKEEFFNKYLSKLNESLFDQYKQRNDLDLPGLAMIHSHYNVQIDQLNKKVDNIDAEIEELGFNIEQRRELLKDDPEKLARLEQRYEHGKDSYELQKKFTMQEIKKLEQKFNDILPIKDIALDRAADLISDLALYAKQKTEEYEMIRPIAITPENEAGPQVYGSHPEEMVQIIKRARKAMQEKLIKQGYSAINALSLAHDHIGATFDMQHFGMFKGYWKGSEEDFNKEYMKQVRKLKDSGIVKHLHIVDGHAGQHVHLPPGRGKLPLKEAVKEFYNMDTSKTSEGWGEGSDEHLYQTKTFEAELKQEMKEELDNALEQGEPTASWMTYNDNGQEINLLDRHKNNTLNLEYSLDFIAWDLMPRTVTHPESTQTFHGELAKETEYLDHSPFFNEKGPWC